MAVVSSGAYTYDTDLIEFVSGVAQLKLPQTYGTITFNDVWSMASLTSIAEVSSKNSPTTDVTYVFKVGGINKYWDGAAWSTSDLSYAKTNSYSVVNTNAASLISVNPSTVQLIVCLKGNGVDSGRLSSVTATFEKVPVFTSVTNSCYVYAYLRSLIGEALTVENNAPELVASTDTSYFSNSAIVSPLSEVSAFAEDAPFASSGSDVIASVLIPNTVGSGQKVRFQIHYRANGFNSNMEVIRFKPVAIPNQTSISLTDLADIDRAQLL